MTNSEYEMDGQLRPITEFKAAFVSFSSSALIASIPSLTGLPITTSSALAVATACMGATQYYNGRKLKKYQQNLVRMDAYSMALDEIPISSTEFWMGRGFQWTAKHSQRVFECQKRSNEHYLQQTKMYHLARKLEIYAESHPGYHWLSEITSRTHVFSLKRSCKKLEKKFIKFQKKPILKAIPYFLSRLKRLEIIKNPLAPLPDLGGETYLHGVGYTDEDNVFCKNSSRNGHTLVLGTTRVGKSRACSLWVSADIARKTKRTITKINENGQKIYDFVEEPEAAVFVLDPKGDAELLAITYSEAKRHNREFYMFNLGAPDITCRYNPIGNFAQIGECATRLTRGMSGAGDSAAFKEFSWRFVNVICETLVAMGKRPSYMQIRRYIMNMEQLYIEFCKYLMVKLKVENWKSIIEELTTTVKIPQSLKALSRESLAFLNFIDQLNSENKISEKDYLTYESLVNSVRYDPTYFSKITASLLPLLDKLCSGETGKILSPDYLDLKDSRPILDITTAVRKKAVVYFGFDAMSNGVVASAVSNSVLSDVLSLSGTVYKNGINYGLDGAESTEIPMVYMHMDEANEMMGDESIPLLNKAAGSGIRCICYTQSRKDLVVRVGDEAKAQVMESNFNTIIMFRVKTEDTANLLIDQLPMVDISDMNITTGVSADNDIMIDGFNSSLFNTRISDGVKITKERKIITADNIISLPKGQAFALLEGSKLYKLRFPLPKSTVNTLPPELKVICGKMKEKYKSYENWWDKSNDTF